MEADALLSLIVKIMVTHPPYIKVIALTSVSAAAFPAGKIKGKVHLYRKAVSAFDSVNQDFGSHLPQLLGWNVDGSQHGRQILGCVNVINTDNRNIPWDLQIIFLKCMHGPDSSDIIAAENGADIRMTCLLYTSRCV